MQHTAKSTQQQQQTENGTRGTVQHSRESVAFSLCMWVSPSNQLVYVFSCQGDVHSSLRDTPLLCSIAYPSFFSHAFSHMIQLLLLMLLATPRCDQCGHHAVCPQQHPHPHPPTQTTSTRTSTTTRTNKQTNKQQRTTVNTHQTNKQLQKLTLRLKS